MYNNKAGLHKNNGRAFSKSNPRIIHSISLAMNFSVSALPIFRKPKYGRKTIFAILPPSNGSIGKKLIIAIAKLSIRSQPKKIESPFSTVGQKLSVDVRGSGVEVEVTGLPFVPHRFHR